MPAGSILVADDDAAIRTVLNQALVARGLRSALDQQCGDALALDQPGRRRPRHHRRGDAGRERLRPAAAHQEAAAGTAGRRHERAEHVHDRDPRLRARRLRISAEAVRPQGTDRDRRPRIVGAEGAPARAGQAGGLRLDSAGRPLAGDAGNLPRAGAADADRSHRDDHGRVRHRQGTGRARAA